MDVASAFINKASRDHFYTESNILAGWPILTHLTVLSPVISLSRTLSTAILEGAQHNILAPCTLTAYLINSTIVVVFPVPGGPWITPISFRYKQSTTACFYTWFSLFDIYSILKVVGSLSLSVDGSSKPHRIILSLLEASVSCVFVSL